MVKKKNKTMTNTTEQEVLEVNEGATPNNAPPVVEGDFENVAEPAHLAGTFDEPSYAELQDATDAAITQAASDYSDPNDRDPEAEAAVYDTVKAAQAIDVPEPTIIMDWDENQVIRIPYDQFIVQESTSGRWGGRSKAHAEGQISSIMKRGQLEPVAFRYAKPGEVFLDKYTGTYTAQGGEYVLASGFGRHEYIKTIVESGGTFPGGPEIRALPWSAANNHEAFVSGLHSNLKRRALSKVEVAHAYHKLIHPSEEDIAQGVIPMTGSAVAAEFGVSKGHVSQHLTLLKLPDKVLKWLHEGRISIQTALDLAGLDVKDQKAEITELEKRIKDGKVVTAAKVRENIKTNVKAREEKVKAKTGKTVKTAKKTAALLAKQRPAKEVKEMLQKQIAAGGTNSGRAKLFNGFLEFIQGKIDEKKFNMIVLAAVPEWKRKQTGEAA